MEALYLLVPLSVILVFLAIWVFFGMSDSGQFDDMDGPALRILIDDEAPRIAGCAGESDHLSESVKA